MTPKTFNQNLQSTLKADFPAPDGLTPVQLSDLIGELKDDFERQYNRAAAGESLYGAAMKYEKAIKEHEESARKLSLARAEFADVLKRSSSDLG